jgi:uncharacterized membrane protein HdeD (DUF308 family)
MMAPHQFGREALSSEASERCAITLNSPSTSLILRGILGVAVGIMALVWPGITIQALVIMFAVYAFIAAGLQAMRRSAATPPCRA